MSDNESFLWYVTQLSTPRWYKEMPKEFVTALHTYLGFIEHMNYLSKKYKK